MQGRLHFRTQEQATKAHYDVVLVIVQDHRGGGRYIVPDALMPLPENFGVNGVKIRSSIFKDAISVSYTHGEGRQTPELGQQSVWHGGNAWDRRTIIGNNNEAGGWQRGRRGRVTTSAWARSKREVDRKWNDGTATGTQVEETWPGTSSAAAGRTGMRITGTP